MEKYNYYDEITSYLKEQIIQSNWTEENYNDLDLNYNDLKEELNSNLQDEQFITNTDLDYFFL